MKSYIVFLGKNLDAEIPRVMFFKNPDHQYKSFRRRTILGERYIKTIYKGNDLVRYNYSKQDMENHNEFMSLKF